MSDKKKCSSKKHENIDAIIFCNECKIYLCNKCENLHSELFYNHHQYKLDKDINDIFTGLCKIENHSNKLEYFCREHNELCCAACISIIKGKGNGQHKDCDICFIEDIKEEKKNKLQDNIKYLNDISKTIEESITLLKSIYDKANQDKEKLKMKIQEKFTKIRNTINEREEQLLLEIDKLFDELYVKEEIIKKNEKLPKQVENSLEITKKINVEWNEINNLNSFINDCIIIEKNIDDINMIKENLERANITNININFQPKIIEEDEIYTKIQNFGKIEYIKNMNKEKEYEIIKRKYQI